MTNMKKALVATLAVAVTLGSGLGAANAHVSKRDARNLIVGATAAAVVISVAKEDCKKWKYRYDRTGNQYFLDRYYACK